MIKAASSALEEMGAEKTRIKFELFTPSTPLRTAGSAQKTTKASDAEIEIVLDGSRRKFPLAKEQPLLEAAAQSGLDLPYSCANGMCATCRCKLVEGEAEMVQNFSLEEWETDDDFVLACQLRALSKKVVLDFDAV